MGRPGRNATGTSVVARELNAKKLELLRELVPTGTVIGVLLNPSNPSIEILSQELLVAAAGLGQQILVLHARAERDFDVLFANLLQQHAHGLVATDDPLSATPSRRSLNYPHGTGFRRFILGVSRSRLAV
jgi:putative ABC transport system substrate-binding protein